MIIYRTISGFFGIGRPIGIILKNNSGIGKTLVCATSICCQTPNITAIIGNKYIENNPATTSNKSNKLFEDLFYYKFYN